MAIIKDLGSAEYEADIREYWADQCSKQGEPDGGDLHNSVTTYIDELISAYNVYFLSMQGSSGISGYSGVSGYELNPPEIFDRNLLEIMGYATFKFRVVVEDDPGVPPEGSPEIMPDDDIRSFFVAWNTLVSYEDWFEFGTETIDPIPAHDGQQEQEGGEIAVINTTPAYDTMLASLINGRDQDIARLSAFELSLGSAFSKKSIYLSYGQPVVKTLEPNNQYWCKEKVLGSKIEGDEEGSGLCLLEVLTFFNWEYKGLNI